MYRERGIGMRLGFGDRPAVIVIDMARAFTDPSYKVGCDMTPTVEAIAQLLAAARSREVPVFYTVVAYRPDGLDGGLFVQKVPALRELRLDDPASMEIDPRIEPAEAEPVITKKYASPFQGTSLGSMLVAEGIDTLILTGCSTSGCVRAAAVDGISSGYRVIVPEEAVADRAEEPHRASLFDIDAKYGDVVTLSETLDYLERLPSGGQVAIDAIAVTGTVP
jgi:nicotinamidase-related amidase